MAEISYRRHRFPPIVIQHAVWLYLRFTLSYRDVEELLAERGLDISYESVRSWVLKFGPLIARRLRQVRPRPSDRWHLDEMVVRIAGKRMQGPGRGVRLPGIFVWADVFGEDRPGTPGIPAIEEEHQTHGREGPCDDRPLNDLARHHSAGRQVEPRAARMGELLPRRHRQQSVPGARQLGSYAVAPVVALQAQGQATQGRDLSPLAPLRALRSRTPERAWAQRAVGEGVTSCPRAGCGKSARPVR